VFVGYFIGSFFSGKISDRKGRRKPLQYGAVVLFISALASSFSPDFILFLSFRYENNIISIPQKNTQQIAKKIIRIIDNIFQCLCTIFTTFCLIFFCYSLKRSIFGGCIGFIVPISFSVLAESTPVK